MTRPDHSSPEGRLEAARSLLLETVMAPDRWDDALTAFAGACGGRSGQIIGLNSSGAVVLHRLTETPPDFIRDVEAFGLADVRANPRLRIGQSAPVMQLRADQDFVSPEDRARTPIYTEMFDPHGFPHNCQIVLLRSPELLVRASVSRTKRQGIFDADALRTFMALAPYLQAAVQTRAALGLAAVHATLATLDAVKAAAFILNTDGRVIGLSRRGADIAERGDGLRLSGGRVKLEDGAAREALEAWLSRLGKGTAPPMSLFTGSAMLDLQPLPPERDGLGTGPAALAILREATTPEERRILIRARYNLTPAEADIALALARGVSVPDIASGRGVSLPTVRSQLQALYAKLDVRRQAELVAKLKSLQSESLP
ncbi:LuxR family transcriptional regulator [Hyphomonas polymorpha PS728]|uniref:LuxR family transcriptional regulator n=1 Tax=Hyphomonas polymorpha PS728 TaxID=1280954 RepID=A0A062V6C2_9PROT|nr:helix-turn-helix transcriptional regulator [Hyphomonas polymorpha]KCZ97603.1 LuxR family transcriptional regulator [Hyphomonas polymorpha PS728]